MAKLYLASKNQHKVKEIQEILGERWTVLPCAPELDWEESGRTFRANALIKAQALRAHEGEGCDILADDSGLAVDVLDGAPGVYSARYAGAGANDRSNLRKLLRVLEGVPAAERAARFVCVLCYIDARGGIHYFEGSCPGVILTGERGGAGFGYDPIFQADGSDQSFAEMSQHEKNRISHRSKALSAFRSFLESRP